MSLPPAQVPSGTVAGEDINDKIQYIYWGLGGGGGGMDPAGSPTLVVPVVSSAQSGVFPIVSGFIRDHRGGVAKLKSVPPDPPVSGSWVF